MNYYNQYPGKCPKLRGEVSLLSGEVSYPKTQKTPMAQGFSAFSEGRNN